MTAKTEDGKEVEHTLIVEPDCATHIHSVVNQLIVLNPIGKVLVNPIPPVDPNDPSEPLQLKAPDLTVAVPRDKVGDTIVVRLLDSGDQPVGGPCTIGPQTIPVEIVALSLQSCEPITVSPHSFFDVFYEIKIGDHTTNHPVRLIDASRLEDLGLETETGSGGFLKNLRIT
ncbi:MAG: hypothetical protein HYW63_00245 [Candidatus Levybacteria bacterium]|nr:hypothetical protein [Candidatus Levybacteria bacterium]